ncbi:hypothetical protein GIB67_028824, partial [Kingdonia uniflora]
MRSSSQSSVDEQSVNVKTDHRRPHALSWEVRPNSNLQNNTTTDAPPMVDSSSVTVTIKDTRKVSHKDVTLVHNLIEHCLQLYMTRDEVVKTLLNRARTEPGFTTL